jgi:hypothetical protein
MLDAPVGKVLAQPDTESGYTGYAEKDHTAYPQDVN